jgi:hypothetical protein
VQTDFEIQKQEQQAVVRICHLLEDMPLTIELSEKIVHEIESNLDFLTTSARDIPERHRSIRVTIDYSWKLLSDEERRVLRQLLVFRGGFSRHAAELVTGASLSTLASMHAKSLIHRTEGERFDLHDLLRKYTLMKIEEAPDHPNDLHEASRQPLEGQAGIVAGGCPCDSAGSLYFHCRQLSGAGLSFCPSPSLPLLWRGRRVWP